MIYMELDGFTMMVDPRITEYMHKKKYYRKHNIKPIVPLEKEYRITNSDLKQIQNIKHGIKTTSTFNQDFVDPYRGSNRQFPSSNFEVDSRFDRLKKKQEKDKEANNMRHNYDIMYQKYDMYKKSNEFQHNPNEINYPVNTKMIYKQPKLQNYNNRLHYGEIEDEEGSLDGIISKIDSFKQKNVKQRDIDMDNYMRLGLGSTVSQSKKSNGYPSSFEHGFQYINDDMQQPAHVVMERGILTRNYNTQRIAN